MKVKSPILKSVCKVMLLICSIFILGACSTSKQENHKPNIILLMADDLGWGDVAYNGHPRLQTPNLDEMAAAGMQFNRFYAAAPVCSPTRGSCLTGRNPYRYGIFSANKSHLREPEISLAEVLKDNGYRTAHFGKWHLGTLFPDFSGKGAARSPEENYMTPGMAGFEHWFSSEFSIATYDPYIRDKEHAHSDRWLLDGDRRCIYVENGVPIKEDLAGCDSKIIMDRAIDYIQKQVAADDPFFTVIWFHAPHAPVVGHPYYMEKYYSDLPENKQNYYSVVTALDAQVGVLRAKLKELGIADHTMLCFTSDNGPEGNPGQIKNYQGTADQLRGRKRSLYEGGIRVPGIIEWPSVIKEHQEIDMPVVSSDYFPTICEVLGYTMTSDRPIDGMSLLDVFEGKQTARNKAIGFQFTPHKQRAMIGDRYKLVQNMGSKRPKSDNGTVAMEAYELYDLLNDESETKNIAAQHPDILEEMKDQLQAFVASCTQSEHGADY